MGMPVKYASVNAVEVGPTTTETSLSHSLIS